MLQTSKHAVEAEIYNSRLKIMNRDLENIQRYLDGVSTESALLVGFTFVSFQLNDPTYLDAVDTPNQWKLAILYVAATVSMSANMFVLCVGELVSILGPRLALKGPKGSMERAVNLMRFYLNLCFKVWMVGLVGFAFMIGTLLFIYIPKGLAGILIICVIMIVMAFVCIFGVFHRVLKEFQFQEPELKYAVRKDLNVPPAGRRQQQDDERKQGSKSSVSSTVNSTSVSTDLVDAETFLNSTATATVASSKATIITTEDHCEAKDKEQLGY